MRRPPLDSDLRRKVLDVAARRCIYCGRKAKTVDHLIPHSMGGLDVVANLVAACRACNQARGAWSIDLFLECFLSLQGPEFLIGIVERAVAIQHRITAEHGEG